MKLLQSILFIFSYCVLSVSLSQTSPGLKEIERHQALVLSNTQVHELHSRLTNIDYKIYINLPASYYTKHSKKSYPTLYLLDADYSFALAKQIAEHLMDKGRIQEFIMVGIAYSGPLKYQLNRTRDYTPTRVLDKGYSLDVQKASGHADRFYEFLQQELIPYIEERFTVDQSRGLVGHSYGGLCAAYGLLYYPSLFTKAIIVSPSLWYDHALMLKYATFRSNFNYQHPHKIFFAIGNQENTEGEFRMVDDLETFTHLLQTKPHQNLSIKTSILKGFDHDTVCPAALVQGLMYLYG